MSSVISLLLRLEVEVQIPGLDTVECVLFLNVCLLQKWFIWRGWLTPAGRVMSDHMTWLCVGLECGMCIGYYSSSGQLRFWYGSTTCLKVFFFWIKFLVYIIMICKVFGQKLLLINKCK